MRTWLAACAAALIVCAASRQANASPDWQFSLSTLSGRTVSMADHRGKWLLIYFGYTFCPDVCPATLTELGDALKALGPRAGKVHALFITLDPTRDKTPVLARYLKAFDPRIEGLLGDAEETENAAKSFHVYYRARSIGHAQYAIDHSSYIYVFDPQGHFVELLAPDAPGHKIADDLKRLVR
jgi:protein SCO1/2